MKTKRAFKGTIKRIMAVAVSAAIFLQSPAFLNVAYAEPAEEETGGSVSENVISPESPEIPEVPEGKEGADSGSVSADMSDPAAGSGSEVTVSGNEDEAAAAEVVISENRSVSSDSGVSGNALAEDGQMVVGGYIEMPWDNDTPVVSADLDYKEALEGVVKSEDDEEPAGYVVEPETIEAKFPAGTDNEVISYLRNRYPATRSQNPYGTCWAHSSIALSEFYMISHGLKDDQGTVDKSVNYSELALAYFCYNQAPDPVNGSTGDTVEYRESAGRGKNFLDFGGNLVFSSQSLMRYNGVIDEKEEDAVKYSKAADVLVNGLDESYASSKDTAHLKNVYHLNIRQNAKLVKQAIKENGIVGVSIYADAAYMNNEHNAFYNNVNDSTNHAVAIVGWDDDFSKDNFNSKPSGNGAWLVRNSWTENTAMSYYSYFWLSYEDKSLADTAYVFEMADGEKDEFYENNYNYDSQLHDSSTANSTTVANVFTSVKSSEILKAVQIDSTMSIAGDYTVKIYENLQDSSDPESGRLASTTTGNIPFAGKATIPLSTAVELSEGEVFSVVVTTDQMIDRERDLIWIDQVVMDTNINEGESFAKFNNGWKDLINYSSSGKYGNLCIRALTDTVGGASLPEGVSTVVIKNRTEQSITLAWSAAKDATGYEVWFSDSEDGVYTKAGTTSGASERRFKHTGLSVGTTYYYKVYPVKNGSKYEAGVSPVVSASTTAATPEVEIVNIGNYSATARWQKLENCAGYEYQIGQGMSCYSAKTTVENEIKIIGLDPGKEHWIKVRSYTVKQDGSKEYSPESRVYFTTENGSGHAVRNLKAEPADASSVKLSWDDQEEVFYYTIESSTDGVTYSKVKDINPNTYTYVTGLDSNTNYYFRVTAVYYAYGNEVPFSSEEQVVSSYPKLPGVSISDLTLTDEGINVFWSAVTGANYYTIYRMENSSSEYIPLTVVPASGDLSYTDSSILPGRRYYYRVHGCRTNTATDKQGNAANRFTIVIPLDRVEDLVISDIGASKATLSWSAIPGAQGYIIKQNNGNEYEEIDRVDSYTTSYIMTGLKPKTRYTVAVVAYTDDYTGGGVGWGFTTKSGEYADKSLFTVTVSDCTYDGAGHGAEVSCSKDEIASAGISLLYGRVVDGSVSSYSAALPVNAGTYRVKINTKASTYYLATELTDESWEFTISPKDIIPTVDLSVSDYTYTGNECRPGVTVKTGGTVLLKDTDYEVSYSDNINAGTAAVTVTSKAGSNYTFTDVTKNFTINKGTTSVTITGGNRSVTYGSGNISLTAAAAVPGNGTKTWIWSSDNTSAATVNAATGTVTIVGQGEAHISAAYSSNDTEGSGSITIIVNKASLTVTAKDNTITYGDVPAGNGVTYSGFVNGDDSSKVMGDVSYSFTCSQYGNVGNAYKITPSGLTAANYDITYVPGTLSVVQKEVGLNWTGTTLTYNKEPQKPSAEASDLVNNDTCTVTVTGEKTDAGSYTATATGLSNPNYKLPSARTTGFTIAKASYGNKTGSASARYGNSGQVDLSAYIAPGGSLKNTGITKVDNDNVLSGTPSVTGSCLNFSFVNDPSKAGKTATVTVGVNGGNNYQDHLITVTLTVLDKPAQTVTFSGINDGNVSMTYGDSDLTKKATANGGGAITYSSSDETVATVNFEGKVSALKAGQAVITATAAATTNYASGSASYTLTVAKKTVGISWENTSFGYDKSEHVPSADATGLKSGDVCTLTVTGGQTNAGTYTATVTALSNDNYRLPSGVTKSFTIEKRPVTVSGIKASDKTYDGTKTAELIFDEVIYSGRFDGDVLSVTGSGTFDTADAGTGKNVTISGITLGGAGAANYMLPSDGQQKQTSASIIKRPVTVKAKDQTVPLKGSIVNNASFAELNGAVIGHTLASVTLSADSTDNVTESGTIKPSLAVIKNGSSDVTGNYDVTYQNGVLTVTKAAPNVKAPEAKDLTFNTKPQKLINAGTSPSGTTMKYSLTENGTYDTAIPEGTAAGDYKVWYRVDGGSNYSDTEPACIDAEIKKAPLSTATVVLGNGLKYSGAVQTQEVAKVVIDGNKLDETEYNVTGNTALNAGSDYKLTVTASAGGNCTGSIQKVFTVAKKDIIPIVNVTGNYTYTGSPIEPEFTVTDGVNELKASDYSARISDNVFAGEGKITVSEKTGGNYTFDDVEKTFTINKADHADAVLSSSAMYGTTQVVDLGPGMEDGAALGTISVSDPYGLLAKKPSIFGIVLSYEFGGTAEDAGKTATITIPVTGADNYNDYSIVVTLTLINCSHPSWVLSGNRVPTCTEKGYTGDKVCTECGYIIEKGSEIDIDPDNHAYDNGKVTEEPTLFKEGVKTFTCTRCGHKRTEAVPKLEGSGDMEEIIEDTKDLSGNSAPEIKQSEDENGNRTETLIVGGEEVSKIVTDKDSGNQTVETKVWIAGLKSSYCYTGSAIKPSFHVYDGTVQLRQNTDYSVSYKNNKNAGEAEITVKFKGNYKNNRSETAKFTISPAVLGEDIVAGEIGLAAKKGAIKVVPVLTQTSTGRTVSTKFFTCDPQTVEGTGEFDVTVRPADPNYTGQTTVKVRVVGDKNLLLSSAKAVFSPSNYKYTGSEIIPAAGSYTLKIGQKSLKEGEDYRVTGLFNNVDPGSATMVFEALSGNSAGYVGSKSASFKITGKKELKADGAGFTYECPAEVPFAKGGARPSVIVRDNGKTLREGTDYTLAYKNNKGLTTGKKAEVTVKGKGIYKGSHTLNFDITKQNLEVISGNILAADQFVGRSKVKSPTLTITDLDGKALNVKKDFTIGTIDTNVSGNTASEGTVKVKVTGTGCYEGIVETSFRYMPPTFDIKKTKQSVKIEDQPYTGRNILLDDSKLTGILFTGDSGTAEYLYPGKDFVVAGYQNNLKKGNAKVTLRGIGKYAGTKVLSFKIVQKNVNYKGALVGGEWK